MLVPIRSMSPTRHESRAAAWLLLVSNLPGHNPTLRMRIWRAMKAAGAGLLRDGTYLLPQSEQSREVFEEQTQRLMSAFEAGKDAMRDEIRKGTPPPRA